MKIAVIGAGISGLTAGRELAMAGHHVKVFEEDAFNEEMLFSINAKSDQSLHIDIGAAFISGESKQYSQLISELKSKHLLQEWDGTFAVKNREGEIVRSDKGPIRFYAPQGLNSIGKYLGRSLDIQYNMKVGGLTNIGENRSMKRVWMLNFTSAATENFDAVIIAVSPRKAYGLLNQTADEREALRLISIIDEVHYASQICLVLCYENIKLPEWDILSCKDEVIDSITNESSKGNSHDNALVINSTKKFAEVVKDEKTEVIEEKLIKYLSGILGSWASLPDRKQLYYRKYAWAENPLPVDYLEFEDDEKPLALIGGYMNGNDLESAYLSGLKLGRNWVNKFSEVLS